MLYRNRRANIIITDHFDIMAFSIINTSAESQLFAVLNYDDLPSMIRLRRKKQTGFPLSNVTERFYVALKFVIIRKRIKPQVLN